MYGSRAVTMLVLISDDVINWILKLDIQANILVYATRCCIDLTSKVLKERTFGQSSAVLVYYDLRIYPSRHMTSKQRRINLNATASTLIRRWFKVVCLPWSSIEMAVDQHNEVHFGCDMRNPVFRPGLAQTNILCLMWEYWYFAWFKFVYFTTQISNNNGAELSARMRSLVCAFAVRILQSRFPVSMPNFWSYWAYFLTTCLESS